MLVPGSLDPHLIQEIVLLKLKHSNDTHVVIVIKHV